MSKMGQLSSRTKEIVFRVWGAACAAGLGFVTINNIPMLGGWENPWCLGAYVAFVVASAILPHIGLALSAIALGVALFAHEGFGGCFLSCILDIPYPMYALHFSMSHSDVTVIQFEEKDGIVTPCVLTASNDSHLYREGLPLKYQNYIYI